MKSKSSPSVWALLLAVTVSLWTSSEASAHRWHRTLAPLYGYSVSYYPPYAYGPGFVYAPNYSALLYRLAYEASYANRPSPFYPPW
jgi:hypothetical protein